MAIEHLQQRVPVGVAEFELAEGAGLHCSISHGGRATNAHWTSPFGAQESVGAVFGMVGALLGKSSQI